MRLLLDECVPRPLKKHLEGHDCQTVPEAGWAGKKNGELLFLAERSGFNALVTLDQGLEYEQNLEGSKVAIIVLRSQSSRLNDLLPLIPRLLRVLSSLQECDVARVSG